MNKRIITSFLSVFVLALLFVASPALAADADIEANNVKTGADSENVNNTEIENDGDFDLDNDADVDNDASADVVTGENEENMNTTGGTTETGDVDASTDWNTVVNEGYGLCGCPVGGDDSSYDVDFLNDTTGYDSKNINSLEVENDGDIDLDNTADVLNKLGLWAVTGKNDSNMNTQGGDTDTGSVNVLAGISNEANVASGSHADKETSVNVDGSNKLTGADSFNLNKVEIDNGGDVDVDNDADIENKIYVHAITGYNDSNKNTTGGDIETGDVDVVTDITNMVNTGDCCIASGKSVNVDVKSSNEETGYDSKNENKVEIDNSGDYNIDNEADVENKLHVKAKTGGNDSNYNTTGGKTKTGSVSIDFTSSTTANSAE